MAPTPTRLRSRLAAARSHLAGALFLMLAGALPAQAQESCRQALVLALDVSGSVDSSEYRLQLDGLAEALTDLDVAQAIVSPGAAPIALYVFEWSGPQYQNVLLDWTLIENMTRLDTIASTLRAQNRSPSSPSTALGTAIAVAAEALRRAPECWKATIDISGDGKSNTGPRPQDLDGLTSLEGITVNALVIETIDSMGAGPGSDDLLAYFENRVIRGPGAFAEKAVGFDDYARAMKKKLLREIRALAIGSLQ